MRRLLLGALSALILFAGAGLTEQLPVQATSRVTTTDPESTCQALIAVLQAYVQANPDASSAIIQAADADPRTACTTTETATTQVAPAGAAFASGYFWAWTQRSFETHVLGIWVGTNNLNYEIWRDGIWGRSDWARYPNCWQDTNFMYGSGQTWCNTYDQGTNSVGIGDNYYYFGYSTPWWHQQFDDRVRTYGNGASIMWHYSV